MGRSGNGEGRGLERSRVTNELTPIVESCRREIPWPCIVDNIYFGQTWCQCKRQA